MGAEEAAEEGFSVGARVAGVVLILNALSLFYANVVLDVSVSSPASSAVVDVGLGVLLIFGYRKVIPFCLFRVIVGGVIYLGWSLYTGDVASAALQVALSGCLLGLLLGTPGMARVGLSTAVALGYVGYTAFLLHTGTRIRNPEALLASSEIEVIGDEEVRGRGFDYHFPAPNAQWFLRSEDATIRDNPIADRWLVRPDKDAHFVVIVEPLGEGVDVTAYEQAVMHNLRNAAASYEVIEQNQLWDHYPQSRFVHARALVKGLSIDYSYGILVYRDEGYQLVGFAAEQVYPAVAGEFRQIFDSIVIGER